MSPINLNKEIADYFLTDAHEFQFRYKLLEEKTNISMGFRSKLLLELTFSLECALKSLIFIESTESEKLTYKKVIKQGHNIGKLVETLTPGSQERYKQIMRIDLEQYKVCCRYLLESEISFSEESGGLGEKYYSTIADPAWLSNIYDQVNNFIEFVREKNPIDFTPRKIADIDIQYEIKKHKILTSIRQ